MSLVRKYSAFIILFAAALTLVLLPQISVSSPTPLPAQAATESIPAYHAQPPTGVLPATMAPETFTDPVVQNAYIVAARAKKVLYQEPCYCHCDRSEGHASLLDCFVSKHGSGCDVCIKEDVYSYEQTLKGKTPAQIRDGITKGEWHHVDLSPYETVIPSAHK